MPYIINYVFNLFFLKLQTRPAPPRTRLETASPTTRLGITPPVTESSPVLMTQDRDRPVPGRANPVPTSNFHLEV